MTLTEKKAAFAKRCGISAARVSQLVKDGLPLADGGEVLVNEALKWMEQRLDPARRQSAKAAQGATPVAPRSAAEPPKNEDDAAEVGLPSPDAPIAAPTLTDAKRLNEIEKIRIARIKREDARKALVSRDIVRRGLHEFGMVQRDAWIAWCSRAAPDVAADLGVDLQKAFAVLDRLVRDQLIHLAQAPLPPALKGIVTDG